MKPGTRGPRRIIQGSLLVVFAAGILAADKTWLTDISSAVIPRAEWFFSLPDEPAQALLKVVPDESIASALEPESPARRNRFLDRRSADRPIPAPLALLPDLVPSARTTLMPAQTLLPSHTTADIAAGGTQSSGISIAPVIKGANSTGVRLISRTEIAPPTGTDATWVGPDFGFWATASNWSPAVVPNGAGVTADFRPLSAGFSMNSTHNVAGGLVLGTLSLAGTGAQGWAISLRNDFTFDNNGNGALLSNVNPAVGDYQLQVSSLMFPITLADNLTIMNTSGSTHQFGSISHGGWIEGTGNLTFINVSNNPSAGQINISAIIPSSFLGTSTIASGAVVFDGDGAFGVPGNQIILGTPGGGSASLFANLFSGTFNPTSLQNSITVSAGTGGTSTIGAIFDAPFKSVFLNGSITLNGSVTLHNNFPDNSIILPNTISGVGAITKTGPGSVFLSGNNTFTGVTIINQGALAASSTNALGKTPSITVNSGGTLLFNGPSTNRVNDQAEIILNGNGSAAPALQTGGNSEHGLTNNTPGMGPVTLQSNSIIDLASATSIIAFANSSLATWTPGQTLSIYNWSGNLLTGNGTDQVYFGSDITGLTALQLQQINFYGDNGVTFLGTGAWGLDLDGEVVPVAIPEPTTWIGAALALGAIAFARRKRNPKSQSALGRPNPR